MVYGNQEVISGPKVVAVVSILMTVGSNYYRRGEKKTLFGTCSPSMPDARRLSDIPEIMLGALISLMVCAFHVGVWGC